MTGAALPPFPDAGNFLKLLADQAPVVFWTTDEGLRFTSSVGAALKDLKSAPGQAVGLTLFDYFGTRDPDFPPIARHREALAGKKSSYEFEWGGRMFHTRVDPLTAPDGKIIGTMGLALDITERKRAEAALQESEDRWKAVVTQAPDFIFILDLDGRIFYINRMTADFAPEDVIGASTLDFMEAGDREIARAAYRRAVERNETVSYDIRANVKKDKSVSWFRNRVGPLSRNGKVANLILVSTDITESKKVEEALQQSLHRMRQLAARIQSVREEERQRISLDIHDRLGQALTGLKLDISSMSSRYCTGAEGKKRAKAVARSLDDAIRTVREISTELRPPILDNLGLKAAIEWQAREFQARANVRCALDLPARDVSPGPALSTAVFRIFQEILTNVVRHARAKKVEVSLKVSPRHLVLSVADDGKGISRKALENPSSLGLLGMRERALAFGGAVVVAGRPRRGTSVTVTIPLERKKKRTP